MKEIKMGFEEDLVRGFNAFFIGLAGILVMFLSLVAFEYLNYIAGFLVLGSGIIIIFFSKVYFEKEKTKKW